MAEKFYTILTAAGKAKIANALPTGQRINLTKIKFGDSNGVYYDPTENQTDIKNKVYESNITTVSIDEKNLNWITLTSIIPPEIGGFTIREIGVYDDTNTLIAIGKYPETYKPVLDDGSTKELYVKMTLEVSNPNSVNLKLDPHIILATKEEVNEVDERFRSEANKLQTQINNLVLGAVGDGNNAEVVQARGSYTVLNDRFNSNENKIFNKIDLNKIKKYDHESKDIIWLEGQYINKDNKYVLYDEACVSELLLVQPNTWYKRNKDSNNAHDEEPRTIFFDKDGNIIKNFGQKRNEFYFKTTEDTCYVKVNINKNFKSTEYVKRVGFDNVFNNSFDFSNEIIDGAKIGWVKNYYVSEFTGILMANSQAKVSNFVKVYPNCKYEKLSNSSSNSFETNVVFYDKNKNFISGIRLNVSEFEFKTPQNCEFIRFDGNINVDIKDECIMCLEEIDFSIFKYIEDRISNIKDTKFTANSNQILNLGANLDSNYKVALTKGNSGYDTVSIESPNIWWDSNKLKYGMVYTGYSDTDGYRHGTICLAWSDDLENWEKDEPILFPSGVEGTPDYGSVTGPHIFFENGIYHLFYIGCEERGYESGHKTICLATGTDIHSLTRYEGNPVIRKVAGTWYGGDVYHPNVIKWTNGMYYLFFNARTEKSGWEEVIGYAVSEDLINWTVDPNISLEFQGPNNGRLVVGDPWLYDIGDENIYMAYFSCNDSGWQTCTDNIAYTRKVDFPLNWKICKTNLTTERRAKPCIVFRNGKHYHFYGNDSAEIGYYLAK